MNKNLINIGTSGWNYKHWKGNFYPDELKQKDFLKFYSETFDTVEINNTFYKLPEEKTVSNWINTVPENFVFAVKASRYITHMKKLAAPVESTEKFFEIIPSFRGKLGPILFQFPPRFPFNPERLGSFVDILPMNYKYAFEFRDASWFNEATYTLLRNNNIAFCIYYLGDFQSPKVVTADLVYIRFHGPYGLGAGCYSEEDLAGFAENIRTYTEQGKQVYCYFNNDEAGCAVKNAAELKNMLKTSQ